MNKLSLWLLSKLQRRCLHPPHRCTYDINEGDLPFPTRWCRICGAYKHGPSGPWNLPMPTWSDT